MGSTGMLNSAEIQVQWFSNHCLRVQRPHFSHECKTLLLYHLSLSSKMILCLPNVWHPEEYVPASLHPSPSDTSPLSPLSPLYFSHSCIRILDIIILNQNKQLSDTELLTTATSCFSSTFHSPTLAKPIIWLQHHLTFLDLPNSVLNCELQGKKRNVCLQSL